MSGSQFLHTGEEALRLLGDRLGRRRIPGIDPGRTIVVCGRLTCTTDHPTVYNPKYELKPLAG